MNKTEFISAIKATESCADMSKKDIEAVIKGMDEVITNVVASEDSVKLGSIGTFSGVTRPAREGRNPATGESIKIAEKRGYPHFKFSSTMKKCE